MCDTIVVVRPEGILFAKNSDRDPNEAQLLEWHAAAEHPAGATVRCTYLEIPQVRKTAATLLSRPFWMWGAEMGANEHGVVIGNEAVFTNRPYAETGLTGMDLLRLALERAASAEAAVGVLTALLERYGQGGGCGHEDRRFTYHNSFLVADPGRAFVLETAAQEWAVEEVEPGVRTISNGLTIESFAAGRRDPVRSRFAACDTRQRLTAVLANDARGPRELMAILRSHGRHRWPRYRLLNGTLGMPCMHGGGTVASSSTTASWVADLRADRPRHWVTATSSPCLSLFKPVAVNEPVDIGRSPTDRCDPETLWWAHELLARRVLRDPEHLAPALLAERDVIESRWLDAPPAGAEAFATHRRLLEKWRARLEADAGNAPDLRPPWARTYWRRRDRAAEIA